MTSRNLLDDGIAHKLPKDLRAALDAAPESAKAWNGVTPLARNEWICWVVTVKTATTRENHVKRAVAELAEGKRRPCCWMGCIHRDDKAMNASQKFILGRTKN